MLAVWVWSLPKLAQKDHSHKGKPPHDAAETRSGGATWLEIITVGSDASFGALMHIAIVEESVEVSSVP